MNSTENGRIEKVCTHGNTTYKDTVGCECCLICGAIQRTDGTWSAPIGILGKQFLESKQYA